MYRHCARAAGLLVVFGNVLFTTGCPGGIPGVNPTDYLKGLLGGTFTTGNLGDGRTGNTIEDLTDIECTFDSICRWGSEGPHESPWYKGSGRPDPTLWQQHTGTDVMPDGNFAIHAKVPGKESDKLMSDPITCLKGDAALSFRYWLYGDASFKVCALKDSDKRTEIFCSREISKANPLVPGSPEETSVEIPGEIDEPFVLAFVPVRDGGFIAIDDPYYDAEEFLCEPTTTTDEPTTTTEEYIEPVTDRRTRPTTEKPDIVTCEKVECNFDAGSQCSWIGLGGTNGASKYFQTYTTRIGNRDTGVPFRPTAQNPRYAGVTLGPRGTNGPDGDRAILQSDGFNIAERRILRFKYYEATSRIQLRVAVNQQNNVIWKSNEHVTLSDRQWQTVEIPVSNVRRIFFIGENHGPNWGSIGIDNIELLVPDGGSNRPAC